MKKPAYAGEALGGISSLGTGVEIISQPENRSVEKPDQPDGTLSKRKSLISYQMRVTAFLR